MTVSITESDYQTLWQPQSLSPNSAPNSAMEVIKISTQWGQGQQQWFNLRQMDLLIQDYVFHQDLQVVRIEASPGCLEFGFQVLGGSYAARLPGESFIQDGPMPSRSLREHGGERVLQVDIHLESATLLSSFLPDQALSLPLRNLIERPGGQPFIHRGVTTVAMQLALRQLLDCPYQDIMGSMYRESKCWELIALKLEQLLAPQRIPPSPLTADDVDRIYAAQQILRQNWQQPPSLLRLARQVGLNDYKLKQGYRQVFGTTAFKDLWHYRMEQAAHLLLQGQYSIQEVALMVGYAKSSNFAAAFRQRFGLRPKEYQRQGGTKSV
ncbi:MAG: AraC family transcriptional regulator [Kaiparowitsia implicata GSE-PSE-MK54-09C]|nr:AraC family transcriptional regulator [Kaiparowitsia implicata GSE-PSE-MK54-09C]